jgi:hypothetical protein
MGEHRRAHRPARVSASARRAIVGERRSGQAPPATLVLLAMDGRLKKTVVVWYKGLFTALLGSVSLPSIQNGT